MVAIIGVGNIGSRLAQTLLRAGWPVTVHDPVSPWLDQLEAGGATVASSVAQAVEGQSTVISSLPTPDVVLQVYLGDQGILACCPPDALLIDTSTIGPDAARRLAEAAASRGIGFVDAPIAGGTVGAETGTLTIFAGAARHTLQAAGAVLDVLASTILHVGEPGAGQAVKLVNNFIVNANLATAAEGLAAGAAFGLDPQSLREFLQHGSAQSFALDRYLPRAWAEDQTTTFSLDLAAKDIDLYAAELQTTSPQPTRRQYVLPVLADLLREARLDGLGDRDLAALVEFYGI